MKVALVFAALIAIAIAAPANPGNPDADAQVLKYDSYNTGIDGFNWSFETSNGISQQEEGQLINAGTDNEAISVRGQFSYPGPDGPVLVTYIADENGFQPSGSHLPAAPQ